MRADTAATIGAPMPAVDVATSISGEALFTRLLYSGPGADILARFPAEALQAEAMATLAFMAQRRPGVPSIRFRPRQPGNRHKRVFGQRWQAESAFSRHKRRLGSAVNGRSDDSRKRECFLRVLTHNLMLLAAAG